MTYDTNQLTRASAINMSKDVSLWKWPRFDKSARSVSVPAVMNQMVTRGNGVQRRRTIYINTCSELEGSRTNIMAMYNDVTRLTTDQVDLGRIYWRCTTT